MALTTFTIYQRTQKAVFCGICLEHITNLYYGNIIFKFTKYCSFIKHDQIKHAFQKKIESRVSHASFNVKEIVNASLHFTVIMIIKWDEYAVYTANLYCLYSTHIFISLYITGTMGMLYSDIKI
jgi:hypothetical protein